MFLRRFFASFSNLSVKTPAELMEKVAKSGKPVLVDFYADWCGPCKVLAPTIEKYCQKNSIDLVKVNVDEGSDLAEKYSVSSIPTVLLFNEGKVVGKFIGVKDEKSIAEFVKEKTEKNSE